MHPTQLIHSCRGHVRHFFLSFIILLAIEFGRGMGYAANRTGSLTALLFMMDIQEFNCRYNFFFSAHEKLDAGKCRIAAPHVICIFLCRPSSRDMLPCLRQFDYVTVSVKKRDGNWKIELSFISPLAVVYIRIFIRSWSFAFVCREEIAIRSPVIAHQHELHLKTKKVLSFGLITFGH